MLSCLGSQALHPLCSALLPLLSLHSKPCVELVLYSVIQTFPFSFYRANFQTSAELTHLSGKEGPERDPVLSLGERISSHHISILQRNTKHFSPKDDAEEGSSCDFSVY